MKIRRLLEKRVNSQLYSTDAHTDQQDDFSIFQLAITYQLGFGDKRDPSTSQQLLQHCGKTEKELSEAVSQIHEWDRKSPQHGTVYLELANQGHIQHQSEIERYRKLGKLEEAEKKIKQEISDLHDSSRGYSHVEDLLQMELISILRGQSSGKRPKSCSGNY
jgi:hypothetical protein